MISHENRLLVDYSNEVAYYIFRKSGKMTQKLSSDAVVISVLRVLKG